MTMPHGAYLWYQTFLAQYYMCSSDNIMAAAVVDIWFDNAVHQALVVGSRENSTGMKCFYSVRSFPQS